MRGLWLLGAWLVAGWPAHAAGDAIMGLWWTADHDGVVEVRPCGAGACARIAGIVTFKPNGAPPVDYAGRSRCELPLIPDAALAADATWNGHITNPDDGKTYTITMHVDDSARLRMRGYIGIPLFGRTTYWTRFTGHIGAGCHITP